LQDYGESDAHLRPKTVLPSASDAFGEVRIKVLWLFTPLNPVCSWHRIKDKA